MKKIFVSLMLSSCLWIAGCDSGPKTVPAEGVLTLKGAALSNASIVVMYPDGNSATGSSDKDGKFSLTYLGRNGAVPGADLKVGVIKQEDPLVPADAMPQTSGGGPPKTEKEAEEMAAAAMKMAAEHQKAQAERLKKGGGPKDLIEAKYRSPDTSGIKLTIPEGGSKELKIEVP